VTNDTPTDTPLTQTPRIAFVKTAAVGGTGKVGDVILPILCSNQYRNTTPYECNQLTQWYNDHWKPSNVAVGASNSTIKERTRSPSGYRCR
jgi:hypothetical protein